jgi:osmotically-inducible protein OsmY/uncharacterized protein (DUF2267 family)
MSVSGLDEFDRTLQTSQTWLEDLRYELGFYERKQAYRALESTLHGLRDCLDYDAAAQLGSRLPMLIRGLYYKGWTPELEPVKHNCRDHLFSRIRNRFREDSRIDPEAVGRAGFKLLSHRISPDALAKIIDRLPDDVRTLFPRTPPPSAPGEVRGAGEDARIESDVLKILAWDARLEGAEITVNVRDGVVRLTGSVPSYAARKSAGRRALDIAGVKALENQLQIVFQTASPPSDAEIQTYIKDALLWSPDVDPSHIQIGVENGRVQLEGTVRLYAEKMSAEEAAGRVTGVQDVINQIAVVPTERILDQAIAQNVLSALELHPELNLQNIDVEVSDGLVTLSGTVPTRRLYQAALDVTRYTRGVVNIEDRIVVG